MEKTGQKDKKQMNKTKIAKFILRRGETSKPEIASSLGISMPTVLQNVKELTDEHIVAEVGEYKSTGGRKAKALSIVETGRYAVGIDITANHISYVLIDLKGNMRQQNRIRKKFENGMEYYEYVSRHLSEFVAVSGVEEDKILGVGISMPGIIDKKNEILLKSHILQVSNVNLKSISQLISYETSFENDANSAAMAELKDAAGNAVYLSLSNSVGGAVYMKNGIYAGDNFRAAEFGHMIIDTEGRECYCGKRGCVDAYCSARILARYTEDNLDKFFEKLGQNDVEAGKLWETYLKYLAVTITNLRMTFDCDVILGGYVGGYMREHMMELNHHLLQYNKFENDTLYVKTCNYAREASAVGIAMRFIDQYFESL